MEIKIYNSLTKKKEIFLSSKKNKVNIYVCGVTVYDYCHLGHARGAINFDVLRRFFYALGYQVHFIKNYTDIDDKIILQANKQGISTTLLTTKMIAEHDKDMASLFVEPPDSAPKATENIDAMIVMIKELIKKNYAYKSGGDVFFRVASFREYGKLSGKKIKDLQVGARVEVNDLKEDALDFALWKAAKKGEPSWESPWGAGRPGWHIECSCMCKEFIDGELDIHGGGADLIFPHHENEIAQSETLIKKKMANYWIHNGMIEIDGKKMSKSLGNFTTIRELVMQTNANIYQGYDAYVVRFFVLQSHYRQNIVLSEKALQSAARALTSIFIVLQELEQKSGEKLPTTTKKGNNVNIDEFLRALADDLNTPKAIAQVFDWVNKIPIALQQKKVALAKENAEKVLLALKILGVLHAEPLENWLMKRRLPYKRQIVEQSLTSISELTNNFFVVRSEQIKEAIQKLSANASEQNLQKIFDLLVENRNRFRLDKAWEKADKIRTLLLELGVSVKDLPEAGSVWRYLS